MFSSDDFVQIKDISVFNIKSASGKFGVKPRDVDALAFSISGDAEFECCGEKIFSHSGDIFFMPKNTPYTARYTDGEIIVFHFRSNSDIDGARNFSGDFTEKYYRLFIKAEFMEREKRRGYKYRCASLLYEIMAGLCAEKSGTGSR